MIRKGKMVMLSVPTQRTDWVMEAFLGKGIMHERFDTGFICFGKIIKRSEPSVQGDDRKTNTEQDSRSHRRKTFIQIGVRCGKRLQQEISERTGKP